MPVALQSNSAFHTEAEEVLLALREALFRLVDQLPGPVSKSRDLSKILKVDPKLSWNVHKLTSASDLLAVGTHVPAATSMKRLISAAEQHGVTAKTLGEVEAAFERFEAFVEQTAGDRASYEAMLAGTTEDAEDAASADLQHRKTIFKSQCHLWGSQIDTFVHTTIAVPSGKPGLMSSASLRMKYGLRRLRADALATVDSYKVTDATGTDPFAREPLDPAGAELYQAALLPQFCTSPIPKLHSYRNDDGRTFIELAEPNLGRKGAVDLTVGEITRSYPLSKDPPPASRHRIGSEVRFVTPTRLSFIDILTHAPTFGEMDASVVLFGDSLVIEDQARRKNAFKLRIPDRVERFTRGIGESRISEIPKYPDALRFAVERLGFNPDDFELYRYRLEYPLLMSVLSVQLRLRPESPFLQA